jgi:uncharacterized protein (DUF488 family)
MNKRIPLTVYTIGHSNHTFDIFLSLLQQHSIKMIADIRSFPGSKKFPHFNRDYLRENLPDHGIQYLWIPKLGGRRTSPAGFVSPNTGLVNPGFRGYADYMGMPQFREGVSELLAAARDSRLAYMCAEALYWQCHRRLLSDYLSLLGIEVFHIMGQKNPVLHSLSPEAIMTPEGIVIYPPA